MVITCTLSEHAYYSNVYSNRAGLAGLPARSLAKVPAAHAHFVAWRAAVPTCTRSVRQTKPKTQQETERWATKGGC